MMIGLKFLPLPIAYCGKNYLKVPVTVYGLKEINANVPLPIAVGYTSISAPLSE